MSYVQPQNNNDSFFVFLGDRSGEAGGGGTGSRPETSWVEGSVSRPAVATGGKRRRGSGSAAASSGADEGLLVLVDAMLLYVGLGATRDERCGFFAPMRVDERLVSDASSHPQFQGTPVKAWCGAVAARCTDATRSVLLRSPAPATLSCTCRASIASVSKRR
jgi:hypothetical protein